MAGETGTVSENVRKLYENLVTHHSTEILPEFTRMEIETPSDLVGEHFSSHVEFITLHTDKTDETNNKIHLFAKRVNEEYRESQADVLLTFGKESGFFTRILPEFNKLNRERTGTDSEYEMNMVPKCYAANEDAIILENLTKRGYDMLNKEEKMNLAQATLVIKQLAKFQAPGYVILSEKTPNEFLEKYPFLEERIYAPNSKFGFIAAYLEPNLGIMLKLLKENPSTEADYAIGIINGFVGKLEEILPPFYKVNPSKGRNIIGHGDMWSNNMLFHKNLETGEEDDMIFVDYQVIRMCLPVLDLSAFLFASVDHQVRKENFNQFLKLYYDELNENVRKLKGTLSFSFEDFVEQFRANFLPGFIGGVAITISLAGLKQLKTMEPIEGEGLLDKFQRAVALWSEKNPEEVKNLAKIIAGCFQEYKILTN